jgi:hypothetical protein
MMQNVRVQDRLSLKGLSFGNNARARRAPMTELTITVREVVRLLLEADSYPRLGNEDWAVARRMEAEALAKAETAVACSDDPPEFARWLDALRRRELPVEEREEIYSAIHDYFAEASLPSKPPAT